MIEFITLGRSAILRDGVECHVSSHKQKLALLSYIAVEGPVARERLLGVFWAAHVRRHSQEPAAQWARGPAGRACGGTAHRGVPADPQLRATIGG